MTIKVLVVDDQAVVRAGLALLIDKEPDMEVVGHAGDGLEAIELARSLEPDIVVMDIRMPRLDGVEATKILTSDEFSDRDIGPLQVIVLTTYDVDESVKAALRAGASGFLLKDATPDELPNAIRRVSAGEGILDGKIIRRLLPEFAARPVFDVPSPAALAALTPREHEVMRLLGFGLSNAEIADYLVVGMATVKTHVARILLKLQLRDRPAAVAAAYQTGLVRPGEAPPARGRS